MRAFLLAPLGALALLLAPAPARADDLPATARRLIEEADKEVKEIEERAQKAVEQRRRRMLAKLEELAASLMKEAKFAQAQAVRDKIEQLKGGAAAVGAAAQADPGTLTAFQGELGKSYNFEVTGAANGTVWGTDLYTDDSSMATAAVHAGVLQAGQKG